jgi:AraC-like DNA-binding protein
MTNKLYKNIQFFDLGFRCHCETPAVWSCFHQHNEVEFMFIKSGYVIYRFGGSVRKISAGETVCFWSSVPHQIVDTGKDSFFEWLTIPLGLFIQWQLPEYFSSKVIQGEMVFSAGCILPGQSPFAQWEKDLSSNNEANRRIVALEAEARLRRMALSIENNNSKFDDRKRVLPFSSGSLGKIEQINLYIAGNYRKKLSIAKIAAIVHLHPNYVVALFRSHCGIGIVDFIAQLRVSNAQRLLSTTNMKMLDIAFDSGFSSISSFYDVFKRLSKKTPSQYRVDNCYHKL